MMIINNNNNIFSFIFDFLINVILYNEYYIIIHLIQFNL